MMADNKTMFWFFNTLLPHFKNKYIKLIKATDAK